MLLGLADAGKQRRPIRATASGRVAWTLSSAGSRRSDVAVEPLCRLPLHTQHDEQTDAMSDPKKKLESHRLERFKTFLGDKFPDGEVEPTEEPDFLVRGTDRIVGIELTDLYRPTPVGQIPDQASESMRKRVIDRARAIYVSRSLPPVLASFFLNDRIHIEKREVERIATQLVDLVAQSIPAIGAKCQIPTGWDDLRELPSVVHEVSVHRIASVTETFFSNPGSTWVPQLTREDVQRTLTSKDGKCPAYLTKCDEVWLLINADMETMATWFQIEPEVLDETFETPFDRVYLVQHFGGRATALKVRRA